MLHELIMNQKRKASGGLLCLLYLADLAGVDIPKDTIISSATILIHFIGIIHGIIKHKRNLGTLTIDG